MSENSDTPVGPNLPKKLKPYEEVRKSFSEALKRQLETQGPITDESIRIIQQSRKYPNRTETK